MTLRDWTDDPWSGGGYSDLMLDSMHATPKQCCATARRPLQFASSELSPSFPGYVEGAIVAGRIAARKVASGARRSQISGSAQSAIATSASGS